jgi:hypothetical protein
MIWYNPTQVIDECTYHKVCTHVMYYIDFRPV